MENEENRERMPCLSGGRGERPSGPSGLLPYRTEVRLIERAIRQEWGLTNEERRTVIDQMLADVRTGQTVRDRALAARTLIAADQVDLARERTQVPDRRTDVQAGLSALRATLATKAGQQALADFTKAISSSSIPASAEQSET
jgi:hypothetical protein